MNRQFNLGCDEIPCQARNDVKNTVTSSDFIEAIAEIKQYLEVMRISFQSLETRIQRINSRIRKQDNRHPGPARPAGGLFSGSHPAENVMRGMNDKRKSLTSKKGRAKK